MTTPETYTLIHHCPVCQRNTRRHICIGVDHQDLSYRCQHCHHYIHDWNELMLTYTAHYDIDDIKNDVFYSAGQWWWIDETGCGVGPYFYESSARRDYSDFVCDMTEDLLEIEAALHVAP